jgi:hypothetical protein
VTTQDDKATSPDPDVATNRKGTPATPPRNPPETDPLQGEGDYESAREYNRATREFVTSGRVDEAARDAVPSDAAEAAELEDAEAAGRARAKEEDPAVDRGESRRGKQ